MDNKKNIAELLQIKSVSSQGPLKIQLEDRQLSFAENERSQILKSWIEDEQLQDRIVAEIDENDNVQDLFLAIKDRVDLIDQDDDDANQFNVKFASTNRGAVILKKDSANFGAMYDELSDSLRDQIPIWYSINEKNVLVLASKTGDPPPEPCHTPDPIVPKFDESHYKPISKTVAEQLFDLMKSQDTDPNSPYGGIPFRYPADGCLGRAHEMCRQIASKGVQPTKIWLWGITDWLTVSSPNHPTELGKLQWDFHVAPAVLTKNGFRVIDPSLEDGPVSITKWRMKMVNPAAQFRMTDSIVFRSTPDRCIIKSDPKYMDTKTILENCRKAFSVQIKKYGPPPYS